MSAKQPSGTTMARRARSGFGREGGPDRNADASLSPAERLSLAAAPVFAGMALLTAIQGGPTDIICSAAHGGSPIGGMVPMYVLMSVFHSPPWLRLIGARLSR
jgi:hypothetical protein